MSKLTEDDLVKAAKALGEATTRCSPEEREHIKMLYEAVQIFADEQNSKGVLIDRSAFFAAGIIFHAVLDNEDLRKAAIEYIDMDVLFTRDMAETSA